MTKSTTYITKEDLLFDMGDLSGFTGEMIQEIKKSVIPHLEKIKRDAGRELDSQVYSKTSIREKTGALKKALSIKWIDKNNEVKGSDKMKYGNVKERRRTGFIASTQSTSFWAGIGIDNKVKIKGRRPANYAHLVENGFDHFGGENIPSKPFLSKAFKDNGGENAWTNLISDSIDKAMKKADLSK